MLWLKVSPSINLLGSHGVNFLGCELFMTLGFSIMDNTGATVLAVASVLAFTFLVSVASLPLTNLYIDPPVAPVIQPLPLILHVDVKAELQKLLGTGIIKRGLPGFPNLAMTKKKIGGMY